MIEDWIDCTFEELTLSLKRGPFGGDLKKTFFVESGFAVYEQQHAINNDFSNIRYFIDEDRFEKLKACNVGPGDYIVSCSGTMGKIARLPNSSPQGVINQALLRIRLNDEVMNHNYFIHFFKSSNFQKKILKDSRGSGMQNMAGIKELKPIPINIPPLIEQQAIVQKIETLFSSLDAGIADLKKAQEQLKIYRQAVLKKAFAGNWKLITIGHKFDFIGGGTPSKRELNYWNGNIPWASVKDIKGDFLNNTKDFITGEGLKNSSANLAKKNEIILITRISPGKSIITEIDTAINQDLKIVKPKFETFNKYIHYLFKSIERKVIKLSSGTTVKGINLNNLKSIEIPEIEIKEQHQIVQEIESRLSVCDKVEDSIKESLIKAQALRQSILKKAFEGKLLSQEEIAKCKAHPDYEPASVLLERIKSK